MPGSVTKDVPGKILKQAVHDYVTSLEGAAFDALPPIPRDTIVALKTTVEMLSNFGRGSEFTRRRLVVDEFMVRLKSSLDDETVLAHTRRQIDDMLPVIH